MRGTCADFGGPKGAKMRPNFDPRRSKIDVENEVEKGRLLKIVLEPSCVDLGSSWAPSWGQNRALARAALVFLKIDFLEKMRVQEATWVDLGSIWVAHGGSK